MVDEREADGYFRNAIAYLQQKNFKKSLEFLDKALMISPNIEDLWLVKFAIFAQELKNKEQAINTGREAVKYHPNSDKLWLMLGHEYFEMSNFEETQKCMNHVLELNPNHREARLLLDSIKNALKTKDQKANIEFIAVELDYRLLKVCEALLHLLDLLNPKADFPDFIKARIDTEMEKRKGLMIEKETIKQFSKELKSKGIISKKLYKALTKINTIQDTFNCFMMIQDNFPIALAKVFFADERLMNISLMNDDGSMIWERFEYKIVLPIDEVFIIPNTEITNFKDFPQGPLNTPMPEYMFDITNPKQLHIRREGGIRARDLKEALENHLPNYGDFRFYERLLYLWHYKKKAIYFLFIGS